MKNMHKFLPFVILTSLLFSCDNGAVKPSFNATVYKNAINIHTPDQEDYLSKVYYGTGAVTQDENINGLEERSRPNPVSLSWETTKCSSGYKIFVSEKEDLSSPWVYETKTNSLDVYNLKTGTKYYYQVQENKENYRISTVGTFTTRSGVRNLYIDGVTNVRDMGGWVGENGKTMKQGLLFRGGRLNNSYPYGSGNFGKTYSQKDSTALAYEREITEKGIEEFRRLGIKNEIDLRNSEGNGYPGSGDDEIIVENVEGVNYNGFKMSSADPLASSTKASLKKTFDFMADKKNYPIYFHCNIGTNRTGTVAMLLEALCGVSEADLMKDYLFSNFGTICVAERQYDKKVEHRASTSDITPSGEVFYRIINASGSTVSERAAQVLLQAGISRENIQAVKDILIG